MSEMLIDAQKCLRGLKGISTHAKIAKSLDWNPTPLIGRRCENVL
jgi:hypothetical protein